MELKYILRNLRIEYKISQEKLATTLGVTRSAVAQWENGFTIPSNEMLNKLCDYFNVSLDYLMGRTDQRRAIDNNITADDFTLAFSNLQHELSEDDKQVLLSLAQTLAEKRKK